MFAVNSRKRQKTRNMSYFSIISHKIEIVPKNYNQNRFKQKHIEYENKIALINDYIPIVTKANTVTANTSV